MQKDAYKYLIHVAMGRFQNQFRQTVWFGSGEACGIEYLHHPHLLCYSTRKLSFVYRI
jgi:hypothetical protein